jgi:hypothetical protein
MTPLSRAEVLALPPAHDLVTLGLALGLSEPTVREMHRSGRLDELGIKCERLGAKYVVITSSVWAFRGLQPDEPADGAGPQVLDVNKLAGQVAVAVLEALGGRLLHAARANPEEPPRAAARRGQASASALRSVSGDGAG